MKKIFNLYGELYSDPKYLEMTLQVLHDSIKDLQRWSVYNEDAACDEIAKLSTQFDIVQVKLTPDPMQEAESYIESGAGE